MTDSILPYGSAEYVVSTQYVQKISHNSINLQSYAFSILCIKYANSMFSFQNIKNYHMHIYTVYYQYVMYKSYLPPDVVLGMTKFHVFTIWT
jgi:hypothetical protein